MKRDAGFTLLEILIAVGVLAIVSTLIVQVLFTTTRVNRKTEVVTDIKQNGAFVLDIIDRLVRASVLISTSCAPGDETTSSVDITNPDNEVTTLTCYSDGNVARIASVSSTQASYLSDGKVTLSTSGGADCTDSSLTFSCPPAVGVQGPLTVSFTLQQPGTAGMVDETRKASFQSTITVRN